MRPFDPFTALALPQETLVDRRVPKAALIRNGAFAARDRRRIGTGIEEIRWLAALKPSTVGIAAYSDSEREYLEIAVLGLHLRTDTGIERLLELVHRAVPYPVVLIAWRSQAPAISLAHKRRSLGESGVTVVDGEVVTARIDGDASGESAVAFQDSLALTRRQLLRDSVDASEEKFGLNWHGKHAARQLALTPSTGTLRPSPNESVGWDTTQNLMIEGDNLEVLKLIQKSYAGKVKLIYIDPPYNTGKDFIHPDDYRDTIRNYLVLTGQVDGENKAWSSNTETSGVSTRTG